MLFTIAVILLVLWLLGSGQRLHSGQLHLRPAGDRARAVRGRPGQRTANRLKMTARGWAFQRTVTRWTCETSIAAVLAEPASRAA